MSCSITCVYLNGFQYDWINSIFLEIRQEISVCSRNIRYFIHSHNKSMFQQRLFIGCNVTVFNPFVDFFSDSINFFSIFSSEIFSGRTTVERCSCRRKLTIQETLLRRKVVQKFQHILIWCCTFRIDNPLEYQPCEGGLSIQLKVSDQMMIWIRHYIWRYNRVAVLLQFKSNRAGPGHDVCYCPCITNHFTDAIHDMRQ